jgi:hypothetical protein
MDEKVNELENQVTRTDVCPGTPLQNRITRTEACHDDQLENQISRTEVFSGATLATKLIT